MNGRYSRCSSISDYLVDKKKDNAKCQITPLEVNLNIADLHQPASMQMNRHFYLICREKFSNQFSVHFLINR